MSNRQFPGGLTDRECREIVEAGIEAAKGCKTAQEEFASWDAVLAQRMDVLSERPNRVSRNTLRFLAAYAERRRQRAGRTP